MKIQFESELDYQQDAIAAVVDIFKGQEVCAGNFTVFSAEYIARHQNSLALNEIGYANKLELTPGQLLANVQAIQQRNHLKISTAETVDRKNYDFSIEMETGTGKTYVYLRSIMEMNLRYGFTKFIIVVPSIPIKEGVYKSLQITENHFKSLYNNIPYSYFVYNSSQLSEIRNFATNPRLQIMVINIDSFRKSFEDERDESKNVNIIHRYNDKLGYKPLSLIQETKPIVIIDEPQTTLSTALAHEAVERLNPLIMLRYSATHRTAPNLLYKLNAIDAYQKQLVKQIEVASTTVQDAATTAAYIKLLSVSNKKGITAKVEIDILENGKYRRLAKEIKKPQDLMLLTNRQEYEGYQVQDIHTAPGNEYIEFNNGTILRLGETIGSVDDRLIKRMMIAKTIEEHLNKELKLNPMGIKVLSLFFIDAVKHYRIYDEDGNRQNGDYATMFEEEYKRIIKKPKYKTLFEHISDIDSEVASIHNGYFSIDKKPKAGNPKEKYEYFKDTKGNVASDEDTYNLIMKKKEELLSFDSKLRFLFSHSALKEGWDNPNVFQICTLKDAGSSEIKRRQEVGRGLRLAVNQNGERVKGFDVNTLTVMASESYEDFVENLQKEMETETGIKFGVLQTHSFNSINVSFNGDEPIYLGQKESEALFDYLLLKQYINSSGKVNDKLRKDLWNNCVELPEDLPEHVKAQAMEILKDVAGKLDIKRHEEKQTITINKQVFLSPDFKELWDRIKHKTTYSIRFLPSSLIDACAIAIDKHLLVSKGKLIYTKATVNVNTGGVSLNEAQNEYEEINQPTNSVPDIISYLHKETQLTRKSIVEILRKCEKINYFKINPQKFIEGCVTLIKEQMRKHIVDGIVYHKMGDSDFYSQQLFEENTLEGYLKRNMQESTKSPYNYIKFDSNIESNLAKGFEQTANVKVYAKLPSWFFIDTPLGNYNPDWAVLVEQNGTDKLFFVIESKGSLSAEMLRDLEKNKIECGKRHFEELSDKLGNAIALQVVSTVEDFSVLL